MPRKVQSFSLGSQHLGKTLDFSAADSFLWVQKQAVNVSGVVAVRLQGKERGPNIHPPVQR